MRNYYDKDIFLIVVDIFMKDINKSSIRICFKCDEQVGFRFNRNCND